MGKNTKILFFSFIFAFALWTYINLNQSYSLDLNIPLEVQSAKSQAPSEEIPNSIDVTLKGKGWDLINIMISKKLTYSLDISRFKKNSKIITEQFINERLNINPEISVVKINPDTISINFDKTSEKLVPIKNNIVVVPKDGYSVVGKPVITPDSVTIKGASYLLNRIKYFPTEGKIFNNVNSDLSGVISLKDTLSNVLKLDISQVNFLYNIQLSAEKNLEDVTVEVLSVPEDKEVLLIPPKVSVFVRGGVEQLAQISTSEVIANVEFSKIENDTLGFVVPEVQVPGETNLLKIEPQKLQYIIKKKL